MARRSYYTFWLAGACVVFFFLQLVSSPFTDALLLNETAFSQPWRFVMSIFLHGGVAHLLYNLLALLFFGSVLEHLVGGKRFLVIYFATGIGANLISVFFYPSSLGASGAIFGIIGALVVIRPLMTVFAFGMPLPMFVAGIAWAVGDLIGAASYLAGNPIGTTGNIAHLSGMALGLLFGFLFRDWSRRSERLERATLDEHSIRKWEDTYLR